MIYALALLLLAFLARAYIGKNPHEFLRAHAGRIVPVIGGVGLSVALGLAVTGRWIAGLCLALVLVWALGYQRFKSYRARLWSSTAQAPGSLRSDWVELTIDQSGAELSGSVLQGVFAGRRLDDLVKAECFSLYLDLQRQDLAGAQLLQIYLDRRFSGWRPAGKAKGNAWHARQGQADAGATGFASAGGMSDQEAYQTLGLGASATRGEIVDAHRRLMKRWHPDQGGSTDMATRINQAKEVLLRLHRS